MEKLLTISVAAYNVENYIEKLLDSVIKTGTLDDIEVLVINDGSKDSTKSIVERYEALYPDSIRLIDKVNGGHGSTINRGIQEAKGKYFRALDGDDWVESANLGSLVKELGNIDADAILSEYCKCYENGNSTPSNDFSKLTDKHLYQFSEIEKSVVWMRYHTVIYKTEILQKNNISLDEHCFYVDAEYMVFPILFVNTVYFFRKFIYCYRLGENGQSVSPSSRIKHINDNSKVTRNLLLFYQNNKSLFNESVNRYLIRGITTACTWHTESLLLLPIGNRSFRTLQNYGDYIHKRAPEIYNYMTKCSPKTNGLFKKNKALYILIALAFRALDKMGIL